MFLPFPIRVVAFQQNVVCSCWNYHPYTKHLFVGQLRAVYRAPPKWWQNSAAPHMVPKSVLGEERLPTHGYTIFPSGIFLYVVLCLVIQSCSTLCDPMVCSLPGSSVHEDSPGKHTRVGCHFLLQGIFLTHRSNPCLLHPLHQQAVSLSAEPYNKLISLLYCVWVECQASNRKAWWKYQLTYLHCCLILHSFKKILSGSTSFCIKCKAKWDHLDESRYHKSQYMIRAV